MNQANKIHIENIDEIRDLLFSLEDKEYKNFQTSLMPTVDTDKVIGVRMPQLRCIVKQISQQGADKFMDILPHKFYEENNIHGLMIDRIKDYDTCIKRLNEFLPYIDNWATCDMISPKCFKKNIPSLVDQINIWIKSEHTYTVRFAIKTLMTFCSGEYFDVRYLDMVASVKSEEYYVRMMVAWYFATQLALNYDHAIVYLENDILDRWVHNKTIQKAIESFRVSEEYKAYLRTLRISSC